MENLLCNFHEFEAVGEENILLKWNNLLPSCKVILISNMRLSSLPVLEEKNQSVLWTCSYTVKRRDLFISGDSSILGISITQLVD